MKSNTIKHSITYFFIVLLISIKMVGLHSFTHEEDDCCEKTPCEICNYAIAHNFTPEIPTETPNFSIEKTTLTVNNIVLNNYNFKVSTNVVSHQLFSRPPPVIL